MSHTILFQDGETMFHSSLFFFYHDFTIGYQHVMDIQNLTPAETEAIIFLNAIFIGLACLSVVFMVPNMLTMVDYCIKA